jgi:hypothetical protein
MIRFKRFLSEQYFLVEDRIGWLKKNTPTIDTSHDMNAVHKTNDDIIDHFAKNADPSKNKEHTQWIVNQYRKKNIQQEDAPQINDTLKHFVNHKRSLSSKNINDYDIGSLRTELQKHVGKPTTNKEKDEEVVNKGRTLLADTGKHQIYHLHDQEASKKIYGGGSILGGNHTDWCTAARSESNMFHHYATSGDLHTIHVSGDKNSPYQSHFNPNTGHQFMDRHDSPKNPHDIINANPELKQHFHMLSPAYSTKIEHLADWKKKRTSDKSIENGLVNIIRNGDTEHAMAALKHPKATSYVTEVAAGHSNPKIAMAGLKHKNAIPDTTYEAARNKNSEVAMAALNHQKATVATTWSAAHHPDPKVAIAALNHPKADAETTEHAALNKDSKVAISALNHSKSNERTLINAASHADPNVITSALGHPKANEKVFETSIHTESKMEALAKHQKSSANMLSYIAHHTERENTAISALNHPNADSSVTHAAIKNTGAESDKLDELALNHKHADTETTRLLAHKYNNFPDRYENGTKHSENLLKNHINIVSKTLNHKKADSTTTHAFFGHQYQEYAENRTHPKIANMALNSSHVDEKTVNLAARSIHPEVVRKALSHKKATTETTHYATVLAALTGNQNQFDAALNHPKADKSTHDIASEHFPDMYNKFKKT